MSRGVAPCSGKEEGWRGVEGMMKSLKLSAAERKGVKIVAAGAGDGGGAVP